jgi:hypothetical protein
LKFLLGDERLVEATYWIAVKAFLCMYLRVHVVSLP